MYKLATLVKKIIVIIIIVIIIIIIIIIIIHVCVCAQIQSGTLVRSRKLQNLF